MELIAASQIPRARSRIAGSAPYVGGIEKVLHTTAADATGGSRLIGDASEARSVLIVAIVADRGLAGSYNSSVLRQVERLVVAGEAEGRSYRLVTVGRKAIAYFRYRHRTVSRSFLQMTNRPSFEDARQVAAELISAFLSGEVNLVQLVSTRFKSAGTQVVETHQVLPLPRPEAPEDEHHGADGFFDFEPEPADLLQLLVPRYAEAVIYRALLEASASEHTARAMNRARQDSITTEILEIVSGAEALRADRAQSAGIDELSDEDEEQIA